jgi:geranylgeranyl pyrophosphate synthase
MTAELEALKQQICGALDARLPCHSEIAQPVVDAMRHSVLGGGKRVRPLLTCTTCMALQSPVADALPAACAVEFIHADSLIHDDLPAMDDDELRHGLPSAHIAFGEANAILAGDSLHSLAFQTIATAPEYDAPTKLKMIQLLSEAAGWSGMAGGQCLDIAAEGRDLDLADLQKLHAAKTGALIRVAVELGALSANSGATDDQLSLLRQFGERIGLAFQVMDDVLDVTQSTDRLGKPAGSDTAAEKNTFPKLMGVAGARVLAHSLVEESLGLLRQADLSSGLLEALARLVVERDH